MRYNLKSCMSVYGAWIAMFILMLKMVLIIPPTPWRHALYSPKNGSHWDLFRKITKTNDPPVLTIFTTFKNQDARKGIHTNVLFNWAQFIPHIRPILFVSNTDPFLVDLAKNLSWMVLPVPRKSEHGVPFLKEMFFASKNVSSSVFYGYCNGDILFDEGLVDTLTAVSEVLDTLGNALVVGQRRNFAIKNKELYKSYTVAKVASPLKLFKTDAEDYFFIAHTSFPWEKIKDVVVGRPGIDNYLVGMAIIFNVSVVDATKTLTALHQSGIDGDFAGFKNKDSDYNKKLIGRLNYGNGYTTSAQYETRYNLNNKVKIFRRPGTNGRKEVSKRKT